MQNESGLCTATMVINLYCFLCVCAFFWWSQTKRKNKPYCSEKFLNFFLLYARVVLSNVKCMSWKHVVNQLFLTAAFILYWHTIVSIRNFHSIIKIVWVKRDSSQPNTHTHVSKIVYCNQKSYTIYTIWNK